MKRKVAALLSAVGIAAGTSLAVVPAYATSFNEMELTSTTGKLSGYCLDGSGESGNGNVMWSEPCDGSSGQLWAVETSSFGGKYRELVNDYSGKCLDNYNGEGNGGPVVIWSCNGDAHQALCWDQYGSSTWPVVWEFSTGITISDTSDKVPAPIEVWGINWSNSEAWFGPLVALANTCA
jgi:hypothetical protein